MLYLSQPIGGGGGTMHPKFGFRIDQVRMAGNSGAPDAGDPLQHRALVGWQMDGLRGIHASDMKVELGGRMTYDVTRGAFATQPPKTSTVSSSRQSALNRADSYPESRPFSPHLFEPSPGARDPFRQGVESSSMVHDITAAAIGTFKLNRPVPAQQRMGLSQRPTSMREANWVDQTDLLIHAMSTLTAAMATTPSATRIAATRSSQMSRLDRMMPPVAGWDANDNHSYLRKQV
jgi:hypothetical protein